MNFLRVLGTIKAFMQLEAPSIILFVSQFYTNSSYFSAKNALSLFSVLNFSIFVNDL